jgi:hypothetical protein
VLWVGIDILIILSNGAKMKNIKLLSLSLVAVVAMMSGHVSAMEEASLVEGDGDDLSSLGSAITDSDERMLYDEKQREARQWFKKNKHLRHDSIVGAGMPPRRNYRAGHPHAELTAQQRIDTAMDEDRKLRDAVVDEKSLEGVPRYELNKFAPVIGEKQDRAVKALQQKVRSCRVGRKRKQERAAVVVQRKFRKRKKAAARADLIRKVQLGEVVVTPEDWVTSEAASGSVEGSSPRELRSGPVLHGNLERFIAGGDDAIEAVESAESFDRRVR